MTDYRLWPSTNSDGTTNGGFTHDLGVQFTVNQANVTFNGFYFWANSGTFDVDHTKYSFRLYSTTNGTSGTLISGTTTNLAVDLTQNSWNYQAISSPIALVNGTTYVAVVHYSGTANSYSSTANYWSSGPGASGVSAGPITAPGTSTALGGNQCPYNEPSASASFPTSSLGSNYWIDVSVSTDTVNAGVAAATASAKTPTVSTSASVQAGVATVTASGKSATTGIVLISQRGTATSATNANVNASSGLACNKPTGVVSGDVLLAQVTRNDSALTVPSGWTTIADQVAGTAGTDHFQTGWYYKVAGGSEPSSYTWTKTAGATSSPMAISIAAFSGVDTSSVIGGSSSQGYNTNQSEPLATGTCASSDMSLTIWGRSARKSSSGPITFTASGVTELSDVGIFSGGSISYSHVMYAANYDTTGNASSLDITANATETHNTTMVLTLRALIIAVNANAGTAAATVVANAPTLSLASNASAGRAAVTAVDNTAVAGVGANAGCASVVAEVLETQVFSTPFNNAPAGAAQVTANASQTNMAYVQAGSAGAVSSAQSATSFAAATAKSVLVSDSFNRADSTTSPGVADSGQAWIELSGNIGLLSGQAYSTALNNNLAYIDSGVADCIVAAKVYATSAQRAGILFRASSSTNYWRWQRHADGVSCQLIKTVANVDTAITVTKTVNPGDIMSVVLSGSAIKCYVNGVLAASTSDSFNSTVTRHGFTVTEVNAAVDDFSVSLIMPQATATAYGASPGIGVNAGIAQVLAHAGLAGPGIGSQIGVATATASVPTVFRLYYGSTRTIKVGNEVRVYRVEAENRKLEVKRS